jgi:hypothetical protein
MSKLPTFIMVTHNVVDSPAWLAMSHGARLLYIALKRRWNHNRKNLVYVSERMAAKELTSDRNQIRRWFRELAYYGFIVMERPGYLGVSGKGKAPHYRLTECNSFALLDARGKPKGDAPILQATREFDRWNGVPFKRALHSGAAAELVRYHRPKLVYPAKRWKRKARVADGTT